MYNLKIEADNIIKKLNENGFEAYFIGNYPFVKKNNLLNPNQKLKIKNIDIVTNAKLEDIKNIFEVVTSVTDYYNQYALIELLIKQNKINFKIYHAAEYTNVVNNTKKQVNTVNEILNEFSFLIDTIRIDSNANILNYSNKKTSSFDSVMNRTLVCNGNFREKLLENPNIIFDLCVHASNISYSINSSYLKVISNNKNYIKYIKLEVIQKYIERILISKSAFIGLKIIKDHLIDLSYNNCKIFEFLDYCTEEDLLEFSKFTQNVDIIARWTFLLKKSPKDKQIDLLKRLKLKYEDKIIWLLNNFDLINEENYKIAIYNSKESLLQISNNKKTVFLLFEMFERLTNVWRCLYESKIDTCNNIIDTICSRPFFDYQILYSDQEIYKILNIDESISLVQAKEEFLKAIILEPKHPNESDYLELLKSVMLNYINNNTN